MLKNLLGIFFKNLYKYITVISENVYIEKQDKRTNKNKNTYHKIIKIIKPTDGNQRTYIGFSVKNNDRNPRFKVSHHVKILKFKSSFAKGY